MSDLDETPRRVGMRPHRGSAAVSIETADLPHGESQFQLKLRSAGVSASRHADTCGQVVLAVENFRNFNEVISVDSA
ncbi:hypothetical protein, partial [Saccharopolyspora sp. NPDC002686]|uniref:hypothetical protein n=1 Tax=Saccharopolyspora sp. NPDC002686 TaxID=3154541 RepID=UPI00331D57E4